MKSTGRNSTRSQAGQLVLVLPITLLITGGVLAYSGYFKQSLITGSYIASRTEVDLISASILQNLRELLSSDSPAGCPIDLSSFRNLNDPSPKTYSKVYELDTSVPPDCLFNPTHDTGTNILVTKRMKSISFSITTLEEPKIKELSAKIQISISVNGRPKTSVTGKIEAIGATSSMTKRFIMQVPRSSYFNVIFTGVGGTPLINHGSAQVQFNGNVLLASNQAFNLSDVSDSNLPSGLPNFSNVMFLKPFYTTAPSFNLGNLSPGSFISEGELKQTFQGGITTSFLMAPFQSAITLPFPPNETAAWSVNYDFEFGMPIPDVSYLAGGKRSYASNSQAFNASLANFNSIPITDPNVMGLTNLDATCPVTTMTGSYRTPALYQYNKTNFTLDFSLGSSSFCGLIAAKKLIIKTRSDPNTLYQIIGNFIVDQIVIQGSGTVIFYNPADNTPLRAPLSDGVTTTMSYINGVFAEMATGNGRPFFTPWLRGNIGNARNTVYWPQRPSPNANSLLLTTSCPGFPGNAVCYPPTVNAIDNSGLFNNLLKPTFFIVDTL